MKKTTSSLIIFAIIAASVSCGNDKDTSFNEEFCSKNTHEIAHTGYFFVTEKDAVNWEATHYGVEMNQETGRFTIFADQFGDDLLTGNQIVLRFTSPHAFHYNGYLNLQAEFNTIIGGDSGVMPYEIDETYQNMTFEINVLDEENQVIEGTFSIRLKRKSMYDDSSFNEYIYLTNGSFRLNYCDLCNK